MIIKILLENEILQTYNIKQDFNTLEIRLTDKLKQIYNTYVQKTGYIPELRIIIEKGGIKND